MCVCLCPRTKKNDVIYINKEIIEEINSETKEKPQKGTFSLDSSKIPNIQVIFENQFLKIINKPYNFPVQKSKKDEIALDEIIKSQYTPKEKSLSFVPGPLHRLDKKTTGLLAFSNNLVGAKEFSNILQNHKVRKTYFTILEGELAENQFWKDSINTVDKKDFNNFKIVSVNSKIDTKSNKKNAITEVFPIKTGLYQNKKITFAKIIIHTGRTHQIRSQCSYHGFPLLGDIAYNKNSEKISKDVDFFLHCYSLTFLETNILELPEKLIAPLPKNFSNFLKKYLSLEDFAL